jgi:hypothetical protein
MDVSGSVRASLDAGYPCRHDERWFSCSVSERKIMNHFVVKGLLLFLLRFCRTASISD